MKMYVLPTFFQVSSICPGDDIHINVAETSAATDVVLVLPPLDRCTKAINYKGQGNKGV